VTTIAGNDTSGCPCHANASSYTPQVPPAVNGAFGAGGPSLAPQPSSSTGAQDDAAQFNSHLHACMRNLGLDFENVRMQRDRLLAEVAELRRAQRESASLNEAVRRLTNELAQLREENNAYREREMEAANDPSRVSRAELEKVLAENAQLLAKLQECEKNTRHYGTIALRAAQYEAELLDAKRIAEVSTANSDRLQAANSKLVQENEELRKELASLAAQQGTWSREGQELKELREHVTEIEAQLRKTKSELDAAQAENTNLRSENLGSRGLINLLAQQISDRSYDRSELENLRQRAETFAGKQAAWAQEKKELSDLLKQTQDELHAAQRELMEMRPFIMLGQRYEQLSKDLESTKLALSEAQRNLANEQAQSRSLAAQAKMWEERHQELETKRQGNAVPSELVAEIERERDHFKQMYSSLQAKYNELDLVLKGAGGAEGLQELERVAKALKKALTETEQRQRETEAELTKARQDQYATAAAFRTLQSENVEIQRALDRANSELSSLRVEVQSLPDLKSKLAELQNQLQLVTEARDQARHQVSKLQQELAARTQDLNIAAERLTEAAGEWKREKQIMLKDIENLKNEAAMATELVMRQNDKISALKKELAEAQARSATAADGTCGDRLCAVKGRRCPCKSRPPPPARWQ